MIRVVSALLGSVLAVTVGAAPVGAQTPPQADDQAEIVVDLDDGEGPEAVADVAQALGLTLRPNSHLASADGVYLTTVPRARLAQTLRRLRADADVEAADENITYQALFTPNDPMFSDQWGLRRLGVERAWEVTCGAGAVVAVVDTGVACENHGDFTRVTDLAGTRCLAGYNFVNHTAHANDDQGHGTHVAGTIAQTTHNALGGAGVAYCATILPVKVLDAMGRGSLANVAEGIRWAADHGAQVINLSLGGDGRSRVMAQAVAYARRRGATVVCAAGNSGRAVGSPANEEGALAVSAIDDGDQIAFFSSRGPEVDLAAPGVRIVQQTICERGRNRCEQFAAFSGTSMAAPHVAGAAALLVSLGVTDPDAVERLLKGYASQTAHGGAQPELYGAGIVSAERAAEGVLWHQGVTRAAVLALVSLLLGFWVKSRQGSLSLGWVVPAWLTGVGGFFLPKFLSHQLPGMELAMRPLASWDLVLLGAGWHRWLLSANLVVVFALVGLGFSKRALRAPIGGVALGIASYLLSEWWLGWGDAPLGRGLYFGWIALNVVASLWVARIGVDRRTADA
ncbi:MAG: peptidase S8 [Myxococcales bacterium]|nr:peptidase S8 [Myxococcales bacterium]